MAEEVKGFAEHFSAFTRHWKIALATFTAIVGIGLFVTLSLPDIYRSSAYILIEEPEIPRELMKSTVSTGTTMQITILNERILTIKNLISLIERYNLYEEERKNTPIEFLTANARTAINIEIQTRETISQNGMPTETAVGFTVSFDDENPEVTKAVATELADLYLEENVKVRAEQTTLANEFMVGEVDKLEQEIIDLENQVAEFKLANSETLPELATLNMSMMQRIDNEMMNIDRQLNAIEDTRISIESQLILIEPSLPTRLPDGTMAMSPADQLKALQTQLSLSQSRYSDDHPDVIRTKKDIESVKSRFGLDVNLAQTEEALEIARANLARAKERYSRSHPDVVRYDREVRELETQLTKESQQLLENELDPDNPAYIQLQATLAQLNAEEKALITEKAEWRSRLVDYEERLMQTPHVEKEYQALLRVLDDAKERQDQMRGKQGLAEIGETLELNAKGERLTLIDAPRVPLRPIKPDRKAILALSFLFALVCGLGITQLVDAIDDSIRGGAAITNVQGVPPLVEIPYIFNDAELNRTRLMRRTGLVAAPTVAIILIVIVHFVVYPLDVVWFTMLQRLGL